MRLPEATLQAADRWAECQSDQPSRRVAIQRLVEAGLGEAALVVEWLRAEALWHERDGDNALANAINVCADAIEEGKHRTPRD